MKINSVLRGGFMYKEIDFFNFPKKPVVYDASRQGPDESERSSRIHKARELGAPLVEYRSSIQPNQTNRTPEDHQMTIRDATGKITQRPSSYRPYRW